MRLMSFQMTTAQARARRKTVTRRLGWRFAKVGDVVQQVEQCQGLKKGETVVRMHVIRFIKVDRERLLAILWRRGDTAKEGFPRMRAGKFIEMFCKHNRCTPETEITRIEFEYVD